MIWPEPVLVGRNAAKLEQLAQQHGLTQYTTDLDKALPTRERDLLRRAGDHRPGRRAASKAIASPARHVYTEKPTAESLEEAARAGRAPPRPRASSTAWWPTSSTCRACASSSGSSTPASSAASSTVRVDFGYWVFEGDWQPAQRPSWNYRAEDGGGIILDMFPHWRYVLDHVIAPVRSVFAHASHPHPAALGRAGQRLRRHRRRRRLRRVRAGGRHHRAGQQLLDHPGRPHRAGHLPGQRHRGQRGGGSARLPRPAPRDHAEAGVEPGSAGHRTTSATQWTELPDNDVYDNGFKTQWEEFLTAVVAGADVRPRPVRRRTGRAAGRARPALGSRGPSLWRSRTCHDRPHLLCGRARGRRPSRHSATIDWDATLRFRHHLWSLGLGVADAMDTAQRGMGMPGTRPRSSSGAVPRRPAPSGACSPVGWGRISCRRAAQSLADIEAAYLDQLRGGAAGRRRGHPHGVARAGRRGQRA